MPLDYHFEPKPPILARRSSNRAWQVFGAVGFLVALVVALIQSFPIETRQPREFLFAGVIIGVTLVALLLVFRSASVTFLSMPSLLVPIGVGLLASTATELLSVLPVVSSLVNPSWSPSLFGLSLAVSVNTVLHMMVWTGYAAWQTDLLWRTAQGDLTPDLAPWISFRKYFLRAFVALAIGVGVLMVSVVPVIAMGAVAIVIALVAMGTLGIVWNVLTFALLPVTMFSPRPVFTALGLGLERSWKLKSRLWKQLAAHLLLLGLLVVVRVHFTDVVETQPGTGFQNVSQNSKTNVKWQVNAFWIGGYEHRCRWLSQYVVALETTQVPFITKTLAALFLVVAAAMKWTVIRELIAPESKPPDAY